MLLVDKLWDDEPPLPRYSRSPLKRGVHSHLEDFRTALPLHRFRRPIVVWNDV